MNDLKRGVYRGDGEAFWTPERCYITELLNTEQSAAVSVALCRVEVGETTQLHALQVDERYIVQSGTGLVELDQRDVFAIAEGDCVLIPAGVAQRVRNTSDQPLEFLCVCTPRFQPSHYVDLETGRELPGDGQIRLVES